VADVRATRRPAPGAARTAPKQPRPGPPEPPGAVRRRRRAPGPAPELVDGVRLPPGLPRRPVAGLRSADVNPRLHSPAQIDALVAAIREYGFLVPVVVDGDGKLVAGHARLEAAARIGLRVVPWIDAAHLSPAQRQAYLIADNQLGLAASWDEVTLGALVQQLQTDNAELLATLGFTEEELDALLADATAAAPEAFRSYDESVETSYQCPQCGFEWSGQPKPGRATPG
jgi:ParB-like nuclease domain